MEVKVLELLNELHNYIESENRIGDLDYAHYSVMIDYVNECLKELEQFLIGVEDGK